MYSWRLLILFLRDRQVVLVVTPYFFMEYWCETVWKYKHLCSHIRRQLSNLLLNFKWKKLRAWFFFFVKVIVQSPNFSKYCRLGTLRTFKKSCFNYSKILINPHTFASGCQEKHMPVRIRDVLWWLVSYRVITWETQSKVDNVIIAWHSLARL